MFVGSSTNAFWQFLAQITVHIFSKILNSMLIGWILCNFQSDFIKIILTFLTKMAKEQLKFRKCSKPTQNIITKWICLEQQASKVSNSILRFVFINVIENHILVYKRDKFLVFLTEVKFFQAHASELKRRYDLQNTGSICFNEAKEWIFCITPFYHVTNFSNLPCPPSPAMTDQCTWSPSLILILNNVKKFTLIFNTIS